MPPIVIAGALAAGGAVAGAAMSGSAAKKAANTAAQASEQNAQIQKQIYDQQRADLQPYAQSGQLAQTALLSRLGLAPPAAANTTPPAAANTSYMDRATPVSSLGAGPKTGMSPMPAAPDVGSGVAAAVPAATGAPAPAANGSLSDAQVQQLLHDRPDIAAEYQKVSLGGTAPLGNGTINNPQDFARYWYDQVRPAANDSYTLPGSNASPGQTTPAAPQAPVPGQTFDSANNAGLGPRSTFTRDAMARPTFNEAQPTFGAAPTTGQYLDPSQFQTSPGYQFRLQQGLRAANANYGARGLLKSDAAIKGLNDYAQGQASSEYGNWFNQQLQRYGADVGQYNIDRTTGLAQYNQNRNVFNNNYQFDANRYDNNFNTDANRYDVNFNNDRGYNTDWYNQYTANLFQLAGMGQNAAAGQGAAGQNYANAMTANNNSLASVQGNAAIAGANGAVGAINGASQAIGYALNPFSVSGSGGSNTYAYSPSAVNLSGYKPSPIQF